MKRGRKRAKDKKEIKDDAVHDEPSSPKRIATPIEAPKRGRGRPRKNPLPDKMEVDSAPATENEPTPTTVKSGKPLATRPPVLSDNKLQITSKKPTTIQLNNTADPVPPPSSDLPQVEQQIEAVEEVAEATEEVTQDKVELSDGEQQIVQEGVNIEENKDVKEPLLDKTSAPKMISTPIEGQKRGRGRPRKNPLPDKVEVVSTPSIVSPPKKQPILTTVKSGKPLTSRPPVLSDNKLQITPKKPVSTTLRLTTTADPVPPRSSFSSLPQVQQHIRPYPTANQAKFNNKKITSLSKYVETLPEISQCVLPNDYDVKETFNKLPDKIVLISTELPFNLAEAVEHSDEVYLFRQAINPGVSDTHPIKHPCLLCKGSDMEFSNKEQRELQNHYTAIHELQVQIGSAKYSDEMVYICLPKSMVPQVNEDNPEVKLSCQYCQPALFPLSSIKEHYETEHGKGVEFIVQDDLNEQYDKFSCSICYHTSVDFEQHHTHMKSAHQLKTFKCKSCSFVTADHTRMQLHFKAKHMLHNSGQNLQCNYCRGLLIGKERLNKHVQQSHMVLTGKEYSCIACRQVVQKGSPLYVHAENCGPANQGIILEKCTKRFITKTPCLDPLGEDQYDCYFCYARIDGKENYERHLTHVHMIWVTNPAFVVDTEHTHKALTIDDMLTDDELAAAHVETFVGHWCRNCDIMIRCYQLYYLHMANHHRMVKLFQCIISGCGASFDNFDKFKEHIETEEHSQRTIISHPDQVHVCVYCDLYFANKSKLIEHLISDSHINKFTNSGHFQRTEARNYKCKACFTMFGMKESYIHHLETESHQYVCPACMIVTAQSAARRAHIQNSHHELINQCDECGQLHVSDSDLTTHFVEHGFTFPCPECPKKFYQREKLNAHMEVHQGEIVCDWKDCNKKIATTSMLVTHYRNHKSNHKCRFCNQSFWNENMLQSHMRSHRPALKQTRGGTMFRRDMNAYSRVKSCEYCDALLKSPREINSHRCSKMPVNKRMLDLVTRAASEISPSTVSTNTTSGKYTTAEADEVTNNDGETQVIMILNQNTGELMEITAPINMNVQDVIDAMQGNDGEFGASIEGTEEIQSLEVGTLKAVSEHETLYAQIEGEQKADGTVEIMEVSQEQTIEMPAQEQVVVEETVQVTTDEHEYVDSVETAEAQEVVEQAVEEVVEAPKEVSEEQVEISTVAPVAEEQVVEGELPKADEEIIQVTKSELLDEEQQIVQEGVYVEEGGQVVEHMEHDQSEYHDAENGDPEVIIVPASMVNADGSIVLDAETIERYNLRVGEDGTIISNHTFMVESAEGGQEEQIEHGEQIETEIVGDYTGIE